MALGRECREPEVEGAAPGCMGLMWLVSRGLMWMGSGGFMWLASGACLRHSAMFPDDFAFTLKVPEAGQAEANETTCLQGETLQWLARSTFPVAALLLHTWINSCQARAAWIFCKWLVFTHSLGCLGAHRAFHACSSAWPSRCVMKIHSGSISNPCALNLQ